MRKIRLNKTYSVMVDDMDYLMLSRWKWYLARCGKKVYAARNGSMKKDRARGCIYMHRIILQAPKNKMVDHINMNGLDNRRHNLRLCTMTGNVRNRPKLSTNTSGFKGVSLHKKTKKWTAEIWARNKKIYLGLFSTKKLASEAYKKAAIKYHGDFAHC